LNFNHLSCFKQNFELPLTKYSFETSQPKTITDFQEFSQKKIHIFVYSLKDLADFMLSVVDLPSL